MHRADAVQHRTPLVIVGVGLQYAFSLDQRFVVPTGKKVFIGNPEMSVDAFFREGGGNGTSDALLFLFLKGADTFLKGASLIIFRIDLKNIIDFY